MKAIGIMEFGGPEVLKIVDLPEPQPGPGEVRIRVHAAAVSPTDITFRSGGRAAQLAERTPPYVPGMDVAGVIDQLGSGTDDRLAVGDAVIAYWGCELPGGAAQRDGRSEQLVSARPTGLLALAGCSSDP